MFYWLVKFTLRPLFLLLFRPVVTGRQHIPRRGGALIASNHLSMTDSLFLPVLTRRRVSFLAKAEYFTGRGLKGRAKAAFVRGTGLIPINREDAQSAAASLDEGAQSVRRGRLLGVYPEGTRSPDGRLYRGKTGAARMAIDTGVPVVPVAMIGTDRVQPIGKVLPRLTRVAMHFGPPLKPPSPAVEPAARKEQLRAFTEQIMAAIAQLSNQERANVDCATHKRSSFVPSSLVRQSSSRTSAAPVRSERTTSRRSRTATAPITAAITADSTESIQE